jgi:hypothetical protein
VNHADAAQECAALYAAMANGAAILHKSPTDSDWHKCKPHVQPTMERIVIGHRYKVQKEPAETVWAIRSQSTPDSLWITDDKQTVDGWIDDGLEVRVYTFTGWALRQNPNQPSATAQQP